MIKKLITLFKLGRKIAKSDILKIASKFKKPPLAVTILFQILSISFEKKEQNNSIKLFCSFFLNERDKIWNNTITAKGGFLNFDEIFKISDFAIFLPNLNKVKSFFIIKFSNHYELKQYLQKDFY